MIKQALIYFATLLVIGIYAVLANITNISPRPASATATATATPTVTIGNVVTLPSARVTTDYADLESTSRAGFMSLVTLPWYESLDSPSPTGHVYVDTASKVEGTKTIACWRYDTDMATGTDAFECGPYYPFSGPSTPGYGENFEIDGSVMQLLFQHRSYALQYSGY